MKILLFALFTLLLLIATATAGIITDPTELNFGDTDCKSVSVRGEEPLSLSIYGKDTKFGNTATWLSVSPNFINKTGELSVCLIKSNINEELTATLSLKSNTDTTEIPIKILKKDGWIEILAILVVGMVVIYSIITILL